MKSNTKIDFIPTDESDFRKAIMANQELVANPVRHQFERSMADILAERAAESIFMPTSPAFIP